MAKTGIFTLFVTFLKTLKPEGFASGFIGVLKTGPKPI